MATNLAIALIVAALTWFIGIKAFLLVHLPIVLLAATTGVWLFYMQHQFEQTLWERDVASESHRCAMSYRGNGDGAFDGAATSTPDPKR
jgi:omega-6 fatty acid desaturase (delta-12 desaturase)